MLFYPSNFEAIHNGSAEFDVLNRMGKIHVPWGGFFGKGVL